MPLYEYKCEKCGELFEVMQKFSDEPLRVHEKCGGLVNRLLSAPALQFKGSGWYVNDYAKATKSDADGGSAKTESSDKKDSGDKKPAGDNKGSSAPSTATTGVSSSSSESKSS
jgi:putative FmdB family regulatory protein